MTEHNTPLYVGTEVPNFELDVFHPTTKSYTKLSTQELRQRGEWLILFFYPADFTFVCATEFAALAEQYERFRKAGAEVVTVSTDTVHTHLAWHREEKELAEVKYPMGADRTGKLAKLFGVYDEKSGNSLRGTFIMNPQGVLTNAEVNFFNLGRNVDELMRKFKANLYLSKATGEVCPAKWKNDGDATLKPGPDLVGRVHDALKK